ncbi:unnamed protein product [Mytilus coruscus]|uniref:Uncharacterized protein n=1 Tax=Mytilus coruscus TaxID=42192 RepID=A0A6J8BAD7_MYTCO|nr:unnamed protein product [Mytilus coruscus]
MYTEGWYKFSGNENVLSKPPKPGQCGSSTPVWFNGQYPTTYAEILTLEACMVVNGTDCEQSWNVSVMHCDEYNVAYIGSPQYYINTACGRYCMESLVDPCSNFSTIAYDFTRHQDYGDYIHNCDSLFSGGWYYFEGGYSLSTTPATPGQCGSRYPIWINESQNTSDISTTSSYVWDDPCHMHTVVESSFDRTANYTLAHGEYEQCDNMYGIYTEGWFKFSGNEDVLTKPPKPRQCGSATPIWFDESQNTSDISTTSSYVWDDPCHMHTVVESSFDRTANYTLAHGEYEQCDNMYGIYTEGWFKFSGNEDVLTKPPKPRQCGSATPIWFDESNTDPCSNFSTIRYDSTRHQDYYEYMSNCDSFYSNGWYYFEGGYNLSTTPAYPGQCGSYNPIWINESQNTSDISTTSSYVWDDPCHMHTVVESSFDRTANYTLAHGEYEQCDNMYGIYTEGWFKFSGNEDVLTKPPKPRQCGSATPIWFDGAYPTAYGEISTLTACLVENDTDCHRSWNVSVMHCDSYNVAYLRPPPYDINYGCGRYCMGKINSGGRHGDGKSSSLVKQSIGQNVPIPGVYP